MRKKITLVFFIFLGINNVFGQKKVQEETYNYENNYNFYQLDSSVKSQDDNIIDWTPSILTFVGLILSFYGLKKQIKTSTKNIIKQSNLERVKLLHEDIARLISEVSQSDFRNIRNGKSASPQHTLLENKIILFLNLRNKSEKELLDLLTKYRREKGINKKEWIELIIEKSRIVLDSKINNQ